MADSKSFDRKTVEKIIDLTYDGGRLSCPVMASEFGAFRSAPQVFAVQLGIVRDQVFVFEEKGWKGRLSAVAGVQYDLIFGR